MRAKHRKNNDRPRRTLRILSCVGAILFTVVLALCGIELLHRNEENRQAVLRAAGSLGQLPAEACVHEELAWRLEV